MLRKSSVQIQKKGPNCFDFSDFFSFNQREAEPLRLFDFLTLNNFPAKQGSLELKYKTKQNAKT